MGLIQAAAGAFGGVMADQWKEFIYCDSLPADVLITKGRKRTSSMGRSSNTSAEDNIISSGSAIDINAGQCMLIVEDGKVVDMCAEPGRYTYDASTEPSIMNSQGLGDFKENVVAVFKQMGKRFTFGGDPGKDQRVYYINTKEIMGNKYGTPSGIPFHICDQKLNVDLDIEIRCFGQYSYRITNPILFYNNIAANVADEYNREEIDGQLKASVISSLHDAFAQVSAQNIRYSQLTAHNKEIREALNEVLSKEWRDLRGIEIVKFDVTNVKVTDEYAPLIKDLNERQLNYGLQDPNIARGHIIGGTIKAMETAAGNESGGMAPAIGFMGMNMAGSMGAGMVGAVGGMNNVMTPQQPTPPSQTPAAVAWKCSSCGQINHGQFCTNCGSKKNTPQQEGWICTCGQVNQGNFCPNCGNKRPADAPLYRCDKCGWKPEDPKRPPKFCPQCGDPFDENDQVK